MENNITKESTADYIDRHIVASLVEAAKQKLYTKDEIITLLYKRDLYIFNRDESKDLELPEDWFEQFKK